MKKFKAIAALALVVVMMMSMTACVATKSNVVGTWVGEYTYNGNSFACAFALDSDGTYAKVTYKNGSLNSAEVGTYEVNLFSVDLHPDGNSGVTTSYKYRFGKLVNNGHEFTKD